MQKTCLLLLFTFFLFSLSAITHSHYDENEIRFVKDKKPLNDQYQSLLRSSGLWQQFQENNPNWFVIFNEQNQLPHRAFGSPIQINSVNDFLINNNFILPNDLRESYSIKNDKYITKKFIQYTSRCKFTYQLIIFEIRNYEFSFYS